MRLWPGRDQDVGGRERLEVLGPWGKTGCHEAPPFTRAPREDECVGGPPPTAPPHGVLRRRCRPPGPWRGPLCPCLTLRGAPEWQTRGRRGLSGPSGRRPRPLGTCSAAPSLPSRKEECGCFLKEKKTLLPLNLRHFPRARKRAWGAGAPRSLSVTLLGAPPLCAPNTLTRLRPASCVRLGRTRSSRVPVRCPGLCG